QRRDRTVRVELQVVGLLLIAVGEAHRLHLVRRADLLQQPARPDRAALWRMVQGQHWSSSSQRPCVGAGPGASPRRKGNPSGAADGLRGVAPGAAPPLHGVMARLPTFAHFDQRIADTFKAMSEQATGLPGYLGIRFVEMTPGRLVATMAVRDELLTPFKTL